MEQPSHSDQQESTAVSTTENQQQPHAATALESLFRIEELLTEILHSMAAQKRMLSMEEACAYLGIGTTEGYARMRAHVRTIKHGRRILVPKEELDSLIEKAKRTGRLFD